MPCPKVLHIFVLLLVTACTNIYAEQLKDDPNYCNIDCDKHRFHIATGQKGGAYYEIGKTLTKMLRREKKDPNYIGFVKSQGSVENLGKVIDDPTYVGIIQSDVIDYNHGRDEYTEFKVVGALYHEPLYILVSRKLRLSSISQLRGKKVSIGLKNSGTQHTSKNMLGIFGISLNEVEPFYVDYAETANLLREEEIHAALLVAAKIPEEIKECIEDKRADIMKISTGDLVKIASADPYLYRLLDVNDPPYDVSDESYVVNDQSHDQNDRTDDSNRQSNDNKVPRAAKKRFRTISVTSVLVAHKDADPNLIKQLAEKIHKLCKLYSHEDNNMHQTRVDANSITTETTQLWVRYPFLLYGKKSSEKIFHEKAHSFYQETDFWRDSTYDKMVPYIVYGIPFLFFTFILVGPILFKWPKRMALNNWPKSIRKRFGLPFIICITVLYMSVITLLYILLYTFELDVGNPEITGKAADLGKMFLLSSRLDNIPTVTRGGQIVIALTSLVGGTVGVVVLMRLSFKFFSDKIREALDMIPINIGKHLVILNWTSKVEGIVKELRSGVTRKKPPVKIVAPPSQEPPDKGRLPDMTMYI